LAKSIIFDVGGVFRHSEQAMYWCFMEAFKKFGTPVSFDSKTLYHLRGLESFNNLLHATKLLYITRGADLSKYLGDIDGEEKLNQLIARSKFDEPLVKKISDEYSHLFGSSQEAKDRILLVEGVEDRLKRVQARNYVLGVLSNGSQKALERDLGHLQKYFSLFVSEAKKPDATTYIKSLNSIGIKPPEAIYVGDAASDIVLAKSAGSASVALLSGMGLKHHLEGTKPDFIFEDVNSFLDFVLKTK